MLDGALVCESAKKLLTLIQAGSKYKNVRAARSRLFFQIFLQEVEDDH